jgi:septin family protein
MNLTSQYINEICYKDAKILIIGQSHTGKTTLANSFIRSCHDDDNINRKYYVVNDDTKNTWNLCEKITWDQLPSISHAGIVIEDMINCTVKQISLVKELLNFKAHHLECWPQLFITHG